MGNGEITEVIITEKFLRDAPVGTQIEQNGHKYEKMGDGKWMKLWCSWHYHYHDDGTRSSILDHFDPK